MSAVVDPDRWNKIVLILVAVVAGPIALERAIGDTILANVILLLLAMGLSAVAALIALVDAATRRTTKAVAGLLISTAPIIYVIVRFAFESVPAGYGP